MSLKHQNVLRQKNMETKDRTDIRACRATALRFSLKASTRMHILHILFAFNECSNYVSISVHVGCKVGVQQVHLN